MKRYAVISAKRDSVETIVRYLPQNYKPIAVLNSFEGDEFGDFSPCVIIKGEDNAGWTLDAYVIPRLASGLIVSKEIDLSHPVMKRIRASEI